MRDQNIGVKDGSVLMMGLGFGSISVRSLELLLLNVCRIKGLEVTVKSSTMFGDIGDGMESPGCIMAIRGEDVYHGLWSGGSRGPCSRL